MVDRANLSGYSGPKRVENDNHNHKHDDDQPHCSDSLGQDEFVPNLSGGNLLRNDKEIFFAFVKHFKEYEELQKLLDLWLKQSHESQEIERVLIAIGFAVVNPGSGIAHLKTLLGGLTSEAALSMALSGLQQASSYAVEWAKKLAKEHPDDALNLLHNLASSPGPGKIQIQEENNLNSIDLTSLIKQLPFEKDTDLTGCRLEIKVNNIMHVYDKNGDLKGHGHFNNPHEDKEGIKLSNGQIIFLHRGGKNAECKNLCKESDPTNLKKIYELDQNGYIVGAYYDDEEDSHLTKIVSEVNSAIQNSNAIVKRGKKEVRDIITAKETKNALQVHRASGILASINQELAKNNLTPKERDQLLSQKDEIERMKKDSRYIATA